MAGEAGSEPQPMEVVAETTGAVDPGRGPGEKWVLCTAREGGRVSDSDIVSVDLTRAELLGAARRAQSIVTKARAIGADLLTKKLVTDDGLAAAATKHLYDVTITVINAGVEDTSPVRQLLSLRPVGGYAHTVGAVFRHELSVAGDAPFALLKLKVLSRAEGSTGGGINSAPQPIGTGVSHVVVAGKDVHLDYTDLTAEYTAGLPSGLTALAGESPALGAPLAVRTAADLGEFLAAVHKAAADPANAQAQFVLVVDYVTLLYGPAEDLPCTVVEVIGVEGLRRDACAVCSNDCTLAMFSSQRPLLAYEVRHLSRLHGGAGSAGQPLLVSIETAEGQVIDTAGLQAAAGAGVNVDLYFVPVGAPGTTPPAAAAADAGHTPWKAFDVDVRASRALLASVQRRVGKHLGEAAALASTLAGAVESSLYLVKKPFQDFWGLTAEAEKELADVQKTHDDAVRAANTVTTMHTMNLRRMADDWLGELITNIEKLPDTITAAPTMGYFQVFSTEKWMEYAQEIAMLVQDETISRFRSWQANVLLPEMVKSGDNLHRTLAGERSNSLTRLAALQSKLSATPVEAHIPDVVLAAFNSDAVLGSEGADPSAAAVGPTKIELELVHYLPEDYHKTMGIVHVLGNAGRAMGTHVVVSQFATHLGLWFLGGAIAGALLISHLSQGTELAALSIRKTVCDQIAATLRERKSEIARQMSVVGSGPLETFVQRYDAQLMAGTGRVEATLHEVVERRRSVNWMNECAGYEAGYQATLASSKAALESLGALRDACSAEGAKGPDAFGAVEEAFGKVDTN